MSFPIASVSSSTLPTQIWPLLSADVRLRAIGLLVQLAFQLVVDDPAVRKEVCSHAHLSHDPQDPA
jgi:hypothetical protein